ncbi:MAG: DUF2277 domain-containing protein [Candidatus Dormibacteria bacterium]
MCRSIKTLRSQPVPVTADDVHAAALQFVRKVSGFRTPAEHNRAVFESAVADVSASTERLLENLVIRGAPPRRVGISSE